MVKALMNTYYALTMVVVQILLGFFSATIAAIVAYGAVAAAVTGFLDQCSFRFCSSTS